VGSGVDPQPARGARPANPGVIPGKRTESMIEIDASAQKGNFNYNNFFKDYFVGEGSGVPDPFDKNHIGMNYDSEKIIEMYGEDFYYYFQTHIVSGTLEEMDFKVSGRTQLSISGLDISNDVGEAGELHWLVAALMGGGHGTGADATYKVLLQDLSHEAQHYIGGSGNDTYTGTNYADRIEGNLGDDTLAGGRSPDTFVFDTELGPNNIDTITDFKVGEDAFELGRKIFADLGRGKLSDDEFSLKKAEGDGAQIVYNKGALFYVDDEGDTTQFAIVGKGLNLSHDDFLVG
jgi:hypothetical protein